jgi:uncharacterized protein (TIGR02246 family)
VQGLLELERAGWEALSTGKAKARAFFGQRLARDAVMVFPGDMVVSGLEAILETFDSLPWSSFEMTDIRTLDLSADAAAVVYRAVAVRPGRAPYTARITSVHVLRDGEWRLALHQQTPVQEVVEKQPERARKARRSMNEAARSE